MRRLRILEAAAEEAIEAVTWYEQERKGLGAEFAKAIDVALDLLETEIIPLANMPGESGQQRAKRLVLHRFPYDIVVRESPHEIIVVAVAHHSRRPGYWRNRSKP